MDEVVVRVIEDIKDRYREPITLDDMAKTAILSPFYFLRVFRRATGVSPGRYLAAVRINEAKRLLLTTSLRVADVSCEVGYASVGTFTSRFTKSVGMPPTLYRYMASEQAPEEPPTFAPPAVTGEYGALRGRLHLPDPPAGHDLYIGAFDGPITQGMPIACEHFDKAETTDFELAPIPPGHWFVQAVTVPTGIEGFPGDGGCGERSPLVGIAGPFEVVPDRRHHEIDVPMRRLTPTDVPILLALPGLHLPALDSAN